MSEEVETIEAVEAIEEAEVVKANQKDLILTEAQQEKIKEMFKAGGEANPPSLMDLTRELFGDEELDGRSKEGRAIKKFISLFKLGAIKTTASVAKPAIQFSDEQKEFILSQFNNNVLPLNIARTLFKNQGITPLHGEYRAVSKFLNGEQDAARRKKRAAAGPIEIVDNDKKSQSEFEHHEYMPDIKPVEKATEPYRPPKALVQTVYRINEYLNLGWKLEELRAIQVKQVEALQGYLNIYRFQHQINSYYSVDDRKFFEDTFIRYTYDKSDLTQEELDQFITLANEGVIASNVLRRVELLRLTLDEMNASSEGRKISMGLNEAIGNAQKEYHESIQRQRKLYDSLTTSRTDRLKSRINDNASVLHLVQAWKQEENRKKMILLAEKQKASLDDEIEKMSTMDEIKSMIRGISPGEVLNG